MIDLDHYRPILRTLGKHGSQPWMDAPQYYPDELLHPMRCKGWSFTGRMTPRLGQFLTGY